MQQEEQQTIPQMVDEVRAGKMPRRNFIKALTAMGISAAGVGAIVATVSSRSFSAAHNEIHAHEHAAQHIQRHQEHIAHQNGSNADALNNDYAEDAVVEDSMHSEPFVGRAAIMRRKNMIFAAASEGKITVTNRIVHGNQVTAEWIAEGIHSGDLPGLPASGRSFSLQGVTVVVRHNGKIVREALYYNVAELRRQLGASNIK
jgi:steroid delta-isomerase-like uncharacterized protein